MADDTKLKPAGPEEGVWKRLTRLFRSGPVIRHKIASAEPDRQPRGSAAAFKKEISSLYVHSLASYGQYERLSRYADYSEMEFCLSYQTLIAIPGGFEEIGKLAEKYGKDGEFVVYSYDHEKRKIVPALAKAARMTRRDAAFTVKFDNGKEITGTSDHRLMLRDGSYKKICELTPGDAMMPFKRESQWNSPYVSVYDGTRWVYEHRMLGEFIAQRCLDDNEVVHHINENKTDNRIENLEVMTRSEHASHHLREYNKLKWDPNNEKWIAKFREQHSAYMTLNNQSARFDVTFPRILQVAEKNDFHLFKTMSSLDVDYPTIVRRLKEQSFKNWESFAKAYDVNWKNHGWENGGEKNPRFDHDLNFQNICDAFTPGMKYQQLADKLHTTPMKITNRVKSHGFKNSHDFCVNYTNCKVLSVTPAGEMDLYDLTVDGYKNFATDSVISHNTPEIASALDIYADETTAKNEQSEVIQIISKNEEIKRCLETLFFDVLNVEFNLWSWVRNLVKYGDFILFVDANEQNGVLNMLPIPINEIEREEGYDKEDPFAVRFRWLTQGNMILQNWQVVHFRLLGNDNFLPYGSSMVEPARRIWRQLILIEDAMLVYRIVRSPERRVFKIDVGNIPPDQVGEYIEKVKTAMKRQQITDPNTGRVDLRYNPLSVDEDYFIPVRGDRSSDISTLAGGQFTGDIDDVQYIQNKVFGALKIPKAYLSYESDLGSKATLAQQDVRFARTIDRIQKIVVSELSKIAIIHLFLLGYSGDDLVDFELKLANSSIIAEQQYLEIWRTKLDIAGAAQEGVFDREFIWKNIFKLSDEQIDQIREGKKFDKIEDMYLEQVQLPGASGMDGGAPGEDELPTDLGGPPGGGGGMPPAEEPPTEGGEETPEGTPGDEGAPPAENAGVTLSGPVIGEKANPNNRGNTDVTGVGATGFGKIRKVERPVTLANATPTTKRQGHGSSARRQPDRDKITKMMLTNGIVRRELMTEEVERTEADINEIMSAVLKLRK